jgi:hypothetical protein
MLFLGTKATEESRRFTAETLRAAQGDIANIFPNLGTSKPPNRKEHQEA